MRCYIYLGRYLEDFSFIFHRFLFQFYEFIYSPLLFQRLGILFNVRPYAIHKEFVQVKHVIGTCSSNNSSSSFKSRWINLISRMASHLVPPEDVKGMVKLDRSKFTRRIKVLSVHTSLENISQKVKELKPYLLKLKHYKSIIEQANGKVILFNPNVVEDYNDFAKAEREKLHSLGLSQEHFIHQEIEIKYDNYPVNDILTAVLPNDVEGSTSYSMIGHICHLNLREHLYAFRFLIGEVLLDKVPNAKSVVNKTDTIDSTYRNFKMEVISGIDDMIVSVKENGCTFHFDFAKVYWNPRLCTEHLRVVDTVKANDYMFDVFAGVGPFTIPAARRKCNVFSNDLNPMSYDALLNNVKKNNVGKRVQVFCLDGRRFIREVIKPEIVKCWHREFDENNAIKPAYHIVMNLPASATEFLDEFVGLFQDVDDFDRIFVAPVVHCHCFSKESDADLDAKNLVQKATGSFIPEESMDTCFVRKVAPNKKMMRIKFSLTAELLRTIDSSGEPKVKRLCAEK